MNEFRKYIVLLAMTEEQQFDLNAASPSMDVVSAITVEAAVLRVIS